MAQRIGLFTYEDHEILGKCAKCAGPLVEALELARDIPMTAEERIDLELGFWTIGYCPTCANIEFIRPAE